MSEVEYQGLVPVRATILPARAAYLVKADSRTGFRRAIQEASTRWGGVTEPILPVGEEGQLDEWTKYIVSISAVEGLVNVDLSIDEAEAAASELGLPWVSIVHIDNYGPVRLTSHPSWLEAPAHPTSWAVSQPSSELWQAVAAGELSDEHLDLMKNQDLALANQSPDGIARDQLLGHTWLDRTMVSLNETYASPAVPSTPTVLWVTSGDDLQDNWHFWNARALSPRTFANMPIFLVPYEDVLHWEFDKHLLSSLDRPNEFSTDVIVTSLSTPEAKLHDLAESLHLRREESEITTSRSFPVTTERRKAPFSYTVRPDVRRFINFDRRYGVVLGADAHFLTGQESSVAFDSPVTFVVEGGTLVQLESRMFDGLPRRDRVASLIIDGASWRDGSLQVGAYATAKFKFDLNVPRLPEVLAVLLQDQVRSHSISDKGSLAAAFQRRGNEMDALLEPNLFEAIRALTTPRSKSLTRELAEVLGEQELGREILELAQSWAVLGKRAYKNVTRVEGMKGPEAAAALERLCELGWAERGLEIKCTTCHTSSFLELDTVVAKSKATCPACDDSQHYTRTPSGPTIFYRLDGLVDRASDQGVFPHLLTISALTRKEAHSWFLPGVDMVFHDDVKNEADVIGLYGGQFAVGEVKTSASEFTDQQLQKDVAVASRLGADVYLMAAPDEISDETRVLAERKCLEAGLELLVLGREDLRPSVTPAS
ncbi:hypothetical protein [Arthrobacter sp. 18067]|uniref:hypothetical protein n=1 Tax=Arthrobacter sp. 18067 TaxID=2681413 RepID=UPI00135C7EFB|nr:hypothetical protein [Arthrobacter sp. 18067]